MLKVYLPPHLGTVALLGVRDRVIVGVIVAAYQVMLKVYLPRPLGTVHVCTAQGPSL